DRRDTLGVDREVGIFVRDAVALAGLEIEQLVDVDGRRVGLDGGGGCDRDRNDLGLHQQALRAGLDQAGAELREIEDAGHQRDQARQVERDDAPGEAREGQRKEVLPGALQPAQRPLPALYRRRKYGRLVLIERRRGVLGLQSRMG